MVTATHYDPVGELLGKLSGVLPAGDDQWVALCPAHEDSRPSLSIGRGDDGRALVTCHAGCNPASVAYAVGLTVGDLFQDRRKPGDGPKIVATYDYRDEHGELLYQVVRREPKDFRQRKPKPGGGWEHSIKGVRRVLYRLPELLASDSKTDDVILCEGEKDVDRARQAGFVATCNSGGAGKWPSDCNEHLRGRSVVIIIPDSDKPGRDHAAAVAKSLEGIARSILIVELKDIVGDGYRPIAKDLSAWFDDGHTADHLRGLIRAAGPTAKLIEASAAVPPWVPFPTDVLPYPLAEFVRASAAAIGCDEALVALPLLGALAGAVGNARRVKLKRTWSEPAVLWACTIGDSGGHKSPGLEAGSRPVFDRFREARREFKQALAKWQEAMETWKAAGAEGPEPEEPKLLAPWIDDATIEAVGAILVENERGTMVIAEELAGWFGSHDQYRSSSKGGDSAKWLRMHGGRELRIDRRTGTPRTLYIPFASVSLTGTIQPGILRKQLTADNRASGMAARLLFAWPPRRPIRWNDAEVDEETTEAVADLFTWLYGLDLWTDSKGDRKPSLVPLADDAKSLFREFVNDHGEEHAGQSGDLAAAFSKLIGYAARFALLFALVRMHTRETDEPFEQVDRQSMADGIALARWFSQEAIRVYRLIDAGQEEQDRTDLLDWIRRQGGSVTPRDVARKGPASCRAAGEAEKSLRDLVARGLATAALVQPDGPGRPAETFTLTS
ncbi:MAG: DUF3987 domain-containing protein [Planctomycetaceae bacterium]|nr:DUF3987 domain-containing protein [Planctomycetaceae bacterium]